MRVISRQPKQGGRPPPSQMPRGVTLPPPQPCSGRVLQPPGSAQVRTAKPTPVLGRAQPWRLDGAPSPAEFPRRKNVGPSQRLTELLAQSQPSPSTPRPPKRTPNAGVRAGFPSRCEAQPGQEEKLGRKAKCFPHSPGDAPSGKTGHKPGRDLVEGRPQPPPQLPLLTLGPCSPQGPEPRSHAVCTPKAREAPSSDPPASS